nr:hypothetical protein CFP56_24098 [Quercus suber]
MVGHRPDSHRPNDQKIAPSYLGRPIIFADAAADIQFERVETRSRNADSTADDALGLIFGSIVIQHRIPYYLRSGFPLLRDVAAEMHADLFAVLTPLVSRNGARVTIASSRRATPRDKRLGHKGQFISARIADDSHIRRLQGGMTTSSGKLDWISVSLSECQLDVDKISYMADLYSLVAYESDRIKSTLVDAFLAFSPPYDQSLHVSDDVVELLISAGMLSALMRSLINMLAFMQKT